MTPIYNSTKYEVEAMHVRQQANRIHTLDRVRTLFQITLALVTLLLSGYAFACLLAIAIHVYR